MSEIDDLKKRLTALETRVSILEQCPKTPSSTAPSKFPPNLIKNIDKIPTKKLVLILLKIQPNQSIPELTENLLKMGWIKDTFFQKNFGTSLINKGLIQKSGSDKSSKDRFSLTSRGELSGEELISKLDSLR
jgi:hypothetical protein